MDKKIKDNLLVLFLLCFASALMRSFIQAPFDASFLAWISMVPFILACNIARKKWTMCWVSYITLAIFWISNLYWISYVTVPGWLAFSIFSGIYWPIIFLALRFCTRKGLPLFISFPIILCGAEALQGIVFRGFDWHLLGHSQYAHLHLIQIADTLGVPGISFIIAMVNGLIADAIIRYINKKSYKSLIPQTLIVLATLAGIVYYGHFRLTESAKTTTDGPLIAAIQPNVPSTVKENQQAGKQILEGLLEQSQKCVDSGAKFIAWPETMVLSVLNVGYLAYCPQTENAWLYHNMISEFAAQGCYPLVGASSAGIGQRDGKLVVTDQYNSAFLYLPNGSQSLNRYDKIHLVPFGEYIPFRELAIVKKLLMVFNPYDYDYSLTRGKNYTVFNIDLDSQSYDFASMICYEDTDADVVRKLAYSADSNKKTDWIVNLSNDGWYVRFVDGKVVPSIELPQRTAISVFRAVENRVSIIRSVNTGISCIIDPDGRLVDGFEKGNLPEKVMQRQGVAGWFADKMPIDTRITFFSKYGLWINKIFSILILIFCTLGIFAHKKERK